MEQCIKKISKKSGHWNQQEHELYLNFLKANENHRKGQRLFKKMSMLIGTRTPSQCRSHHQKFNPKKSNSTLKAKQLARIYMRNHKESDESEQ